MFSRRIPRGIPISLLIITAFALSGCGRPDPPGPSLSARPSAEGGPESPEGAKTEEAVPAGAPGAPRYSADRVAAAKEMASQLGVVLEEDDDGGVIGLDTAANRSWVDDYQLSELLVFGGLKSLTLEGPGVTNAIAPRIAEFDRLEELALRNTMIDDDGLAQLAKLKSLKVVDLRLSPMITDSGAETLAGLDGLRAVRVSGVNLTDAGLETLLALPELSELDVRNCRGITRDGIGKLAAKETLRALKLGGPEIDDAVLETVGSLKNLTTLSLDNCDVTDAGVTRLGGLPLVDLTVYQCPNVTDEGLAVLSRFADLRRLTLRDVKTEGAALNALPEPEKLVSLNLAQTRFDDARARNLARFANLQSLDLSETPVSDASVEFLSTLKRLKTLVVSQTEISPEGVRKLEEALPECRIRST